MSRFNVLMENKFMGCMIIALGRDEMRDRHVVLYAIPDDEVHVGVHDGIDSWIASAAQNPFGLDSAKRLREVAAGHVFEIEQGQTFRRFEDGTYKREIGAPRTRRRLGGAIAALPLPLVPVASPMRERKRILTGHITINGEPIDAGVSKPIIDEGTNRVIKERRRVII